MVRVRTPIVRSFEEKDICFERHYHYLEVTSIDIRDIDVMSRWTQVFILFVSEYIESYQMHLNYDKRGSNRASQRGGEGTDLCVSVFASLTGAHLHDLTRSALNHNETVLTE
jgi:hypothetical protein